MDDEIPTAEAIAVRGDRIAAVGSDAEIRPWIGEQTRVMELNGELTIPGFIDGHGHFVALGRAKRLIDVSCAKTYDELVRLVRDAAAKTPAGRWIEGRGWHQAKWRKKPQPNVEGYPTHEALSRATPDHPVVLTHASGHMCLANAKAMRWAGINERTRDPPGGEILRDASGTPTGVLREDASGLIYAAKNRSAAGAQFQIEFDEAVRLASDECLAHGVTSFQDAGSSFAEIDRFRRLAESGRLPVRLWVMIGESNASLARQLPRYRFIGLGDDHLTVRAIKRFVDGALGTHGAWLLEPYSDLPRSRGMNTTSLSWIRQTARLAIQHDLQLCVHAIGDRANRETLNIFEEAFHRNPGKSDLRWRIEHAQHLHPNEIPRFSELGVIASMQAIHCTSDAAFVVERLGNERSRQGAYAWRSLIDAGAVVSNGTDTPVEGVNPIEGFYAAVTRRPVGQQPFFPEQRMTRQEALRSYTLNAAHAAFEEHLKGSLSPGKLADIVVLSHDILTVPEDKIREARVLYTIVGGTVVYEFDEGAGVQESP
jgi:predicted amidohydrolase YtcJ